MLAVKSKSLPAQRLRKAVRQRRLDAPVQWLLEPAEGVGRLAGLLFAYAAEPLSVVWKDAPLAGPLRLDGEAEGKVVLTESPAPDGRRRLQVLSGYGSLLGLLESKALGAAVVVADKETRNELDRVNPSDDLPAAGGGPKGGGGEPAILLPGQMLQPWLSNLEFVRRLIAQWNRLRPHRPLALSAGPGWEVVGTWHRSGAGELLVPGGSGRVVGLASGATLRVRHDRSFDAGPWLKERDTALPHWSGWGGLVVQRDDELRPGYGGNDRLEWAVECHVAAHGWAGREATPTGYALARGTVTGRLDAKRLKITLDDADPAAGEVTCLALTASAGKRHNAGANLLPYRGATVLVAVSAGLGGGPPVCLGEVRCLEAVSDAPSLEFEELLRLLGEQGVEVGETSGKHGRLTVKQGKVTAEGT